MTPRVCPNQALVVLNNPCSVYNIRSSFMETSGLRDRNKAAHLLRGEFCCDRGDIFDLITKKLDTWIDV